MGFPGDTVVKYSSVNAGDKRDVGSVPGSGDSLEKEMSTHPSILAWKISWTEEPGELWSMGWHDRTTNTHMHTHTHTHVCRDVSYFYIIHGENEAKELIHPGQMTRRD